MRSVVVVVALTAIAGVASAQAPGASVPAPYAYQPVTMTQDEQDMLARGEISDNRVIGAGLTAMFVGFGTGQVIEHRWTDTGWIFTFGESAATVAMFVGLVELVADNGPCYGGDGCRSSSSGAGLFVGSGIVLAVLRVWETIDAFHAPAGYNRKVRELRARVGYPDPNTPRFAPYIAPAGTGQGGVAGLSLRF